VYVSLCEVSNGFFLRTGSYLGEETSGLVPLCCGFSWWHSFDGYFVLLLVFFYGVTSDGVDQHSWRGSLLVG